MNSINAIIKELNVKVVCSPLLDKKGYCVELLNIIVINSNLSEQQQKNVLLHELGHIAKQRHEANLYSKTEAMRLKMEHEANEFMVNKIVNDYISNTGVEISDVNYQNFAINNSIDASLVKDVLKKKYNLH
ncbi:ImmA/IrrE family metallo-endopeptidase [Ligilactobacillus cholophilus]|uniref:ImmA/IrrE family metallo-endopeptidase n=1 Tax=Ligilactobacillus cholophilus TaxID=3050131 RepID=UPI0025AF451F|nr:ImmA/IrrE family metallo-endopeptidase [Ligilactobacillus cholophilus]